METVIHPLALTAIFQHAAAAQHRQVTGNFRLAFIQRAGQLAHAQLAFAGDEQGDAHASLVRQAFEYGGRCQVLDHENTLLTLADRLMIAKRMRRRIYCLTHIGVKRRLLAQVLKAAPGVANLLGVMQSAYIPKIVYKANRMSWMRVC